MSKTAEAENIRRSLASLAASVDIARRRVDGGDVVELLDLDRAVGEICSAVGQLPLEHRAGLKPPMVALIDELDKLSATLKHQHSQLDRKPAHPLDAPAGVRRLWQGAHRAEASLSGIRPVHSMDYDIFFRFLLALIFVLGLIGLLAWAARRFGVGGRVAIRQGRRRRMSVVEAAAVDAKHRLVLVRRDNVEHLVMLGPTVDLVIEQGIAVPAEETDSTAAPAAKAMAGRATSAPSSRRGSASRRPARRPPSPPRRRRRRSPVRRSRHCPRPSAAFRNPNSSQLKPERLRFGKQPGTKR